jgi:hypothetical protein
MRKAWKPLSTHERVRLLCLGVPGGLCLAFILYVGVLAPQPAAANLDAHNCARSEYPNESVLILLDTTDALSQSQIDQFKATLRDVLDRAQPGELVSVAEIQTLPVRFDISLCSPQRGAPPGFLDALRNPAADWHRVRADWQRRFDRPMRKLIDTLPYNRVWPRSPIIQSIDDATDQLGDAWSKASRRRLIIFSDMMENTDQFSQYTTGPAPVPYDEARAHIPYIRDAAPDLRDADVEVYYLLIPRDAKHQTGDARRTHQTFWQAFFTRCAGRVARFSLLPTDQLN